MERGEDLRDEIVDSEVGGSRGGSGEWNDRE